jgi:hypothetical protein
MKIPIYGDHSVHLGWLRSVIYYMKFREFYWENSLEVVKLRNLLISPPHIISNNELVCCNMQVTENAAKSKSSHFMLPELK